MLMSRFLLPALKETPSDATLISHQLMLRSGMIRPLASGLYVWLPLGLRVLHKIEAIVREEMNRIGALEMTMPMVQPGDLWEDSGRWEKYGPELLRFGDRHDNHFCLGPTHEEVITAMMRNELKSYKQLPMTIYQIQTKFRDEIRPRFGVMRSREFLMKDAYSFHISRESMQEEYERMFDAYTTIFERLGLSFRAVLADSGAIGGSVSHEFQVLADSGEDIVVHSNDSDYAANLERAEAFIEPNYQQPAFDHVMALEKWATPECQTIDDLYEKEGVLAENTIKTLLVKGEDVPVVALVIRGDHELNEIKAEKIPQVSVPLTFIDPQDVKEQLKVSVGSIGVVDLKIPVVIDHAAADSVDFICGANDDGYHYRHVCWGRDVAIGEKADLRQVVEGDWSPDGQGRLCFRRGIEVGHIFQLGDQYSQAMKATVLNDKGKAIPLMMGCYGIGISRIVAAAIEQYHDDSGIMWPQAMAPFQLAIVPMQMHKSYRVREQAEQWYQRAQEAGIDVLFDDRKERPGVLFSTMDLIGIPHRLVISEKGIDQGVVEYKARSSDDVQLWPQTEVMERLLTVISKSR